MFASCRGENMVTRDSASKQIVCSGTFGPHRPWKRTWRRLIQRSKTRCNYTGRAKSTTRRLIVCTPWHIVHQEAFETTARETLLVVLLLGNRKEVCEPGDDADCWQSQVDRKSYIAHSRDLSWRPTFTSFVHTIRHEDWFDLYTKVNDLSNCYYGKKAKFVNNILN